MTLRDFRAKHGLSLDAMAERVGISKAALAMIEGGNGCRLKTAKSIVDASGGEVSFEDLLLDPATAENGEQEANGSSGA